MLTNMHDIKISLGGLFSKATPKPTKVSTRCCRAAVVTDQMNGGTGKKEKRKETGSSRMLTNEHLLT